MIALMILMLIYARYVSKRENIKAIDLVSFPITPDGAKYIVVAVTMSSSKKIPYVMSINKSKSYPLYLLTPKIKKYSHYISMKSSKHSSAY